MWLIVPFVLFLLFVLIGGALVGGIYADVLIPLVVLLMIAVGAGVMKRRRPREADGTPKPAGSAGWPPPVGGGATGGDTPPEPTTPEGALQDRRGA